MIQIDQRKCIGCGICVDICHESCLFMQNGFVAIEQEFCSTCTQCVAVCPHQAISWKGIPPQKFQLEHFPAQVQIKELLQQRRTNRHFSERIPSRELIAEVVEAMVYAPKHSHDFRVVAVDDPAHLNILDQEVYRYTRNIYRYVFQPFFIPWLLKWTSPSLQMEFRKARPKLEHCLAMGRGYESLPPVLIFVVGEKNRVLSLESAQYMLYSMDLYGRSRGLGFRNLVGNQMFFNRSIPIRKMLGLNRKERIYAAGGLGYPTVHFQNKVTGRKQPLRWTTGENGAWDCAT